MSESEDKAGATAPSRRSVLRFGAAAVPAFATLKASPAAATNSVLTCQIPLTLTQTGNKWVKSDGTTTNAPGSWNSSSGPHPALSSTTPNYSGEKLRSDYLNGTETARSGLKLSNSQNVNSAAYDAHVEYIKKLSYGKAGYTCYASIYTSLT